MWRHELEEKGWRHGGRRRYCRRGHPLRGDNVVIFTDGGRRCRTCKNEQSRRWKLEHREPRPAVRCKDCGAVLEPGPRGRLPERCSECKRARKAKLDHVRNAAKRKEKNVKTQ